MGGFMCRQEGEHTGIEQVSPIRDETGDRNRKQSVSSPEEFSCFTTFEGHISL